MVLPSAISGILECAVIVVEGAKEEEDKIKSDLIQIFGMAKRT